jgi:hypothetical protein
MCPKMLAGNDLALDGWAIYNFLPERLPSKRTKS